MLHSTSGVTAHCHARLAKHFLEFFSYPPKHFLLHFPFKKRSSTASCVIVLFSKISTCSFNYYSPSNVYYLVCGLMISLTALAWVRQYAPKCLFRRSGFTLDTLSMLKQFCAIINMHAITEFTSGKYQYLMWMQICYTCLFLKFFELHMNVIACTLYTKIDRCLVKVCSYSSAVPHEAEATQIPQFKKIQLYSWMTF